MWEDGLLTVVAVFGKYEVGATSDFDPGIAAYNQFIASVAQTLGVTAGVAGTAYINGRAIGG